MVAMNVWPTDGAAGSVANEARWRAMARYWVPTGVVADNAGGMAPSLNGTSLTVRSGVAWVDGHFCELTSDQVLTVTANGIAVVRFDPAANTAELLYRDGITAPAQSPTGTFELLIAKITASVLTDARPLLRNNSPTVFASAAGRTAGWVGTPQPGQLSVRGDAPPGIVNEVFAVNAWQPQQAPVAAGYYKSGAPSAVSPPNDVDLTAALGGRSWPFPVIVVCQLVQWAGFATQQATIDYMAYSNAAVSGGAGGALFAGGARGIVVPGAQWSSGYALGITVPLGTGGGFHLASRVTWTGGGAGVYHQAFLAWQVIPTP